MSREHDMTQVKKTRIVSYTPEEMFNLVNAVEHYPEFLPYCAQSQIHHRDQDEVQATLVISAAGFQKSFTTHNRLQTNKMIEIRLIDGPFKHLEGFWRFDEVPEGCHVSFDLEFEFSAGLMAMLFSPVFEQIANKMVDAFCERAKLIYAQN